MVVSMRPIHSSLVVSFLLYVLVALVPTPLGSSWSSAAEPTAEDAAEPNGPDRDFVNSIGMTFRVIPAGTFRMGSEAGNNDEQPVHEVTISRPFYLGVCEVTNANGFAVKGFVPSGRKEADRPIESVTWDEAVAFAAALSSLPAERAAGRVYRLPTEAEWEYACRAGTSTAYSFGDDASLLGDFAWFDRSSGGRTQAVGQKQANAWGLYDMHGNVWEWCGDWLGKYPTAAETDPQGPAEGVLRVPRGGGFSSPARSCRSARRGGDEPSIRSGIVGFRLALSPSGGRAKEASE